MDCIDLMREEHENVMTLVTVFRSACCRILEGGPVEQEDFRDMITFARTYADRHHHGKEEQILFREMMDHLGTVAVNLIQHGMLVEHDMGRFHISQLEEALSRYQASGSVEDKLEIVANAAGWANLLQRHIEKEDSVVYEFARNRLPGEVLQRIDREIEEFENQEALKDVGKNALILLERLENKYCLGTASLR